MIVFSADFLVLFPLSLVCEIISQHSNLLIFFAKPCESRGYSILSTIGKARYYEYPFIDHKSFATCFFLEFTGFFELGHFSLLFSQSEVFPLASSLALLYFDF